ncbi:peptidase [Methyloceanibacter stevinii]|uniref:Peptidase n=1 Tax=Methyloceanibacter stevinii TaxID=1774970 RepID=A0A1E3VPJ8_9HYPH|nr:type II toxin-antitoxin system RelE/ParE family toxin [Methyloceanibacter stevinii]ODR95231.1 peptidase [Methyloceanibacter stevinii]
MIRSFRSRALKRFFERGEDRQIKPDHREALRDVLARLDASSAPEDMNLPGFRLHRLRGDYAGFWAVTVRANWRVTFRFEDGDATDVDYLDYH